ncbi:YqiA/YcfP family alpha/beta fold hydrolase [Jeongeupia naejangsanensis]|uniref:Esterase YqiA n=1 Tax=Jeongeupia naejangsanensis TaxID=613195 RepID=A0ABS2BPT8_9NEIS|nr:YqiA/YcfP family alpha/beta fold hydrolase [Jeongeupia naejangsanensis]MBM3117644.1 esterase YqiA [Jeongeupia naejangsanensis]
MQPVHLVYLHGFLSSPFSQKAQDTAVWMAEQRLADYFHCPQLPMAPEGAREALESAITRLHGAPFCLIGSSLGGYFATWAAEEYGSRAILVNPAIRPYELLKDHLGPQRNYQTGEYHVIDASFAPTLKSLERDVSDPRRYWLLAQTGDEVLDYREAVDKYAGCRQTVIDGGDHSFQNYPDWLPAIWDFAQGQA